jgi:uncharacterized protein (DUF1778 family)
MPQIAPVSFRMPEVDIAVIDRAAKILGRSRTEFVRDAALRAAEAAILEETTVRLSPDQFDWLGSMLDHPAPPNAALRDVLADARSRDARED